MTTPGPGPIAGAKTVCSVFPTANRGCVSGSPCGMAAIPILKERLFGLAAPEGNHGEDVKELYYYLDSTPTHSYFKALYKYPLWAYPYERLVREGRTRDIIDPEFEIEDSGVFDRNRYVDVTAEYAKASPTDIAMRITLANRSGEEALLHVIPQLWFRNTWAWGREGEPGYARRPGMRRGALRCVAIAHEEMGRYLWEAGVSSSGVEPVLMFTENETNMQRLFGSANPTPFVKDAFHERVVFGRTHGDESRERGNEGGRSLSPVDRRTGVRHNPPAARRRDGRSGPAGSATCGRDDPAPGRGRPTSSTNPCFREASPPTRGTSSDRATPRSSGRSSSTTSMSPTGSRETQGSPPRPRSGSPAATGTGRIW